MTVLSKPFRAATPSAILPVRMVRRAIATLDRIPYLIGLAALFPAAVFCGRARPRSQAGISSRAQSLFRANINCR